MSTQANPTPKVINCECGAVVRAASDDDLVEQVTQHVEQAPRAGREDEPRRHPRHGGGGSVAELPAHAAGARSARVWARASRHQMIS